MNIEFECRQPNSSIPDAFDTYLSVLNQPCSFTQTESGAKFNTGRPYPGFQRCSEIFSCSNANEIVYFKFNQFEIDDSSFAYFAIGLPKQYEAYPSYHPFEFSLKDFGNFNFYTLLLSGSQQTGVWVSAESIKDFRIYFYRNFQLNNVNFEYPIILKQE